jgi:acetyl-CoA carboxylase biotin carboxyl carrier protein
MSQQNIKELLELINTTDIEEFKYKSNNGDFLYLYIRRLHSTKSTPFKEHSNVEDGELKKDNNNSNKVIAIKSTVVGIFSNIQVNGMPLLIKEGDNIEIGQKVGQVEAMKLIKDICSPIKGKVLEVLISNGQTVEYGQELFILECKS